MIPKSIKNHEKNDIKKDMEFWRPRRVFHRTPGVPVNPVNIQKTMLKTTKKEDNLKEVYLKKANSLLRRKSDVVWRKITEKDAQREPKANKYASINQSSEQASKQAREQASEHKATLYHDF